MADIIVIGLGAIGSSAAYHLAQRGNRVVGFEQFIPAHENGSSHGASRIIRQAYYEHPSYVPLLLRSYELWERLQCDTGADLLHVIGGLMIGPAASRVVRGSIESARLHNLPHEILDSAEIHRRFPPFTPSPDEIGLYESRAGYLRPEECIRQHLKQAARFGADLHFQEPVEDWTADDRTECVEVRTSKGRYEAERLVICSGAWMPQILSKLHFPLKVTRQVMFWFDPIGGTAPFLEDRFPIYIWQPEASLPFYGFPSMEGARGGVKTAIHAIDDPCTPETIHREIGEKDLEAIRELIASRIPSLNGKVVAAKTCMYTMTPDENFIVGLHPQHLSVSIAAGFSGHGFKFSTVMGEVLADLATQGTSSHSIDLFSTRRFNLTDVSSSHRVR